MSNWARLLQISDAFMQTTMILPARAALKDIYLLGKIAAEAHHKLLAPACFTVIRRWLTHSSACSETVPWGCRSRTAVAPLERLKILMQVQGSSKVYTGVWQVRALDPLSPLAHSLQEVSDGVMAGPMPLDFCNDSMM